MSTPNTRPPASINQRRSQRILLAVRILVTGKRSNGGAFSERTSTVVVSAHGALLRLQEPVQIGQVLTLKNVVTTEEIVCTVVDINNGNSGNSETPEIGIEFAESCPRFWRVSFPPANWSSKCPEAKRLIRPKTAALTNATPPLVKKL